MRRSWATVCVALVVALCVGAALGLRWGANALEAAYDAQLAAEDACDLTVSFAYGLTDEDATAIADLDGVRAATRADNTHVQVWGAASDPAQPAAHSTFSAAYQAQVASVAASVRALGAPRAAERYEAEFAELERLIDEAQTNVDNRRQILVTSEESTVGGEGRIEEREAELASARDALANATAALSQLNERYARERADAQKKLDEAKKASEELKKKLDEAKKKLEEKTKAKAEKTELESLQKEVDDQKKELDEKTRAYDSSKKAFDALVASYEGQIATAEAQVSNARGIVDERDKAVSAERAGLDTGRRKVREYERNLEAAQHLLDARLAKRAAMAESPWVVEGRLDDGQARAVVRAARWLRLAALAFVAVALVACTGQRSMAELDLRRMLAAGLAGALAGCALAAFVVAGRVRAAWSAALEVTGVASEAMPAAAAALDGAAAVGAALVVLSLARLLRRPALAVARALGQLWRRWASASEALPAQDFDPLPNDRAGNDESRASVGLAGDELSDTMPLAIQAPIRETTSLDNKATSGPAWGLALACCAALAVFAALVAPAAGRMVGRQYGELNAYDAWARVASGAGDAAGTVARQLEDAGCRVAPVLERDTVVLAGEGRAKAPDANPPDDGDAGVPATLVVSLGDDWFCDLYRSGLEAYGHHGLGGTGAWVACGPDVAVDVKPGNKLQVRGPMGETREIEVLGTLARALPGVELVMGADAYEETFGVAPTANGLLVDTRGEDVEALGVDGLTDVAAQATSALAGFSETLRLMATVIALAALLCLA